MACKTSWNHKAISQSAFEDTSNFSSVQFSRFFISATYRTKYLHQHNYTTEKGTYNKTKQR